MAVVVTGDRALQKKLARLKLSNSRHRQLIARSLVSAGQPIAKAARRGAPKGKKKPEGRKAMKSSIRLGKLKRLRQGEAGAARVRAFVPHFHLVERGTGPRQTETGASRGSMPANPFLQKAGEGQSATAAAIFTDKYTAGLVRLATK